MPTTTLYVATSNPGKLRDFAAAADFYGFAITPLPCLDRIPAPSENEATFEGNAREKAIYYSRFSPGYDIIADDSGLEVDALNGDPGVRSARYAADNGFSATRDPDQDNNLLLLQKLAESQTPPPATAASSPSPETGKLSSPPTALSRAASRHSLAAMEASDTTHSSICPNSTKPWPRSTSQPNQQSAIADGLSTRSSKTSKHSQLIESRQVYLLLDQFRIIVPLLICLADSEITH